MSALYHKQYVDSDDVTYRVTVAYDKGGESYNGKSTPRGYYITVVPVKLEHKQGYTVETSTAYSGIKKLLMTVARSSKKYDEQALELGKSYMQSLIDYVKGAMA